MEFKKTNKGLWDAAGKAALALGGVSCAYLALSQLLAAGTESTVLALLLSLCNIVLWCAKLVGCVLLMRLFMRRYAQSHEGITHSGSFAFGAAVALLSALIYSAFYMAYITFIAPDTMEQALNIVRESYSSLLTSDMLETLENTDFGRLSFFSNLIYCALYGTVLSAILSRNIPSDNPFANDNRNAQ